MFQGVGLSDSFKSQLIFGGINFGCTFLGIYIMERFGRRWPLIIGGLWQSAWLFAYASVGVTHDSQAKGPGTFLICATAFFILGYASTWAPGIWILTGETFPTRTRQKQASLAVAANWIFNFLIAFFTPFITHDIALAYGYVFAGCNLFGAVFVYLFLYDSADLTLEQVNKMYGVPGLKAWQSGKWLPAGYSTRDQDGPDNEAPKDLQPRTAPGMTGRNSDETLNTAHPDAATREKKSQVVYNA